MQPLRVNEMFLSIQGEGLKAGMPTWFVRLAGCNLKCSFCDTKHNRYNMMFIHDIIKKVKASPVRRIIWTGGEPTLQLTDDICGAVSDEGIWQGIESNGTGHIPDFIDWVTISPKEPDNVTPENITSCDELKYVMTADSPLPEETMFASHVFLSPVFVDGKVDQAALKHCIQLCLDNPQWRLTMQYHKVWGVE